MSPPPRCRAVTVRAPLAALAALLLASFVSAGEDTIAPVEGQGSTAGRIAARLQQSHYRPLTIDDQFSGQLQQVWRLDVTGGQELGAVRVDGERQLITSNPQTGAPGVEIRNRDWYDTKICDMLKARSVALALHDLYYMPRRDDITAGRRGF